MENGFSPISGVDSSTLELLINPQFLMEEKEEEETRMKKEKKNSFILKKESTVFTTDDAPDFFKPKFRYLRHKKVPIILKRIRF